LTTLNVAEERLCGVGTAQRSRIGHHSVAEGSITILEQHKIRLSDIDTPERKQPFGTRAKQALSELAFGKHARVAEVTKDRYGRIVGRVYVDGLDVNAVLVRGGYAWVYRKYSQDGELLKLEAQAKEKGLGLWADPNPIPPWEWRRGKRQ
jgi:endonuclease YncB( thermonuclease family)